MLNVQVLSINGYWWYAADRDLARQIVKAQNEGLAKWVATHPDRFVALASTEVACKVRDNANCANKKKPSQYLKSQIFIDTMIFSEEGLRHLVAEVGAGQIVYGTDVPFNWPAPVDMVLNAPFLSDADKEAILSGNLMKLLRIDSLGPDRGQ